MLLDGPIYFLTTFTNPQTAVFWRFGVVKMDIAFITNNIYISIKLIFI